MMISGDSHGVKTGYASVPSRTQLFLGARFPSSELLVQWVKSPNFHLRFFFCPGSQEVPIILPPLCSFKFVVVSLS